MPNLSEILEWKYGPVAGTKQKDPNDKSNNPEMIISSWNHETISQPSEQQIEADMIEFQAFLDAENVRLDAVETAKNILVDKYLGKGKSDITIADMNEWNKLRMVQEMGLSL